MDLAPNLKLSDGAVLPRLGLGTYPMDDAEAARVIDEAINLGYRLFDSAVNYRNESGVGEGIRRNGIERDQVFITTKVPGRDHGYESTKRSLDQSLERMGLDYLDLYLIHWPNPIENKYVDTWRAFVDLQKEGKVRSIGVSNFKPAHLDRLRDETGVLPSVNQIQLYPGIARSESRTYHEQNGIVTESWSPLGRGANASLFGGSQTFLENPTINAIAGSHDKTAGQIVLKWHVQLGLLPLPKSSNPTRLAENLDVFSFELTEDEMAQLTAIDTGGVQPVDSDTHQEF